MTTIYFDAFIKATARITLGHNGWFATIELKDRQGTELEIMVPHNHEHRVQALQAAFEVVDRIRAALLATSDVVMKEDMQESLEVIEQDKRAEAGSMAV